MEVCRDFNQEITNLWNLEFFFLIKISTIMFLTHDYILLLSSLHVDGVQIIRSTEGGNRYISEENGYVMFQIGTFLHYIK